MADSKISALTAVTTPAATDEFAVNQSATSKKMTLQQIHFGDFASVMVAASNSTAKDKGAADYVCDGTADEVQINSAITDINSLGGTVILAPGTYTIAAAISFTANVKYHLFAYGAKILMPASISGIVVNQGNSTARGVRLEGVWIDGQSGASTIGVEFKDTNNPELIRAEIENCAVGFRMNSNAASAFVEGAHLDDVLIRNCTTGWDTVITSGTGSFAQTVVRALKITGATTGISFPNGSIMQRGHIEATVWIASSQTAVSMDCNLEDLTFDLAIEGAAASTGNTGLVIGTNATNTEQMFMKLLLTGTINTIANFNSKNVHYWSGGSTLVQSAGTAVIGYRRHGDSTDRLRLEGLTAGGRIQFGTGAALDTNIYRSAADVLSSDDKFDPASLNLQVKAGVPADGDITGGAAEGDAVLDSTGKLLYVRMGTAWVPIGTPTIERGGTVLSPAAAINIIVWRAPYACTVTNVRGYRVGGTGATINARLNGASNHLASALSLTSADTWMDGGSVQNTAYAAGDKLEIMVVSVAGAPTQVAIQVDFKRP